MTTHDIESALARSVSHNEIACCEYYGTERDLLLELANLYPHEIDSVRTNDGDIDVWGYRMEAPEGDMDWRLSVTLVEAD